MRLGRSSRAGGGFTLPEVVIGAGIASPVLAALALGSVALQKNFVAVDGFGAAQSDQMRALDYVTRDIRRSTAIAVTTSPDTLALTIPNYIDTVTGQPRNPTLAAGAISYSGATTVTYSLSGSDFVRDDGTSRLIVARTVTSFTAALDAGDPDGKTVDVAVGFVPQMQWALNPGAAASVTIQARAVARN